MYEVISKIHEETDNERRNIRSEMKNAGMVTFSVHSSFLVRRSPFFSLLFEEPIFDFFTWIEKAMYNKKFPVCKCILLYRKYIARAVLEDKQLRMIEREDCFIVTCIPVSIEFNE